jgi:hypothetical protein
MRTLKNLIVTAGLALAAIAPNALHATDVIVSGRDAAASEKVGTINGAASLLSVSNATVTSTASTQLAVQPLADLAVWISAVAANAGTSNLVVGFNFSPDNVTYSTTLPLTLTTALTGTNPVTSFFILNRTNFTSVKFLRWDSTQTAQTNLVTISAITYRYLYP